LATYSRIRKEWVCRLGSTKGNVVEKYFFSESSGYREKTLIFHYLINPLF
jgi:hypothetical protein